MTELLLRVNGGLALFEFSSGSGSGSNPGFSIMFGRSSIDSPEGSGREPFPYSLQKRITTPDTKTKSVTPTIPTARIQIRTSKLSAPARKCFSSSESESPLSEMHEYLMTWRKNLFDIDLPISSGSFRVRSSIKLGSPEPSLFLPQIFTK